MADKIAETVRRLRHGDLTHTRATVAADLIEALAAENAALKESRSKWMIDCFASIGSAYALRQRAEAAEALNRDYEDALQDKRRLAREIDVAMHGEDGAAKQASLCDLVHPARALRAERDRLAAELAEARTVPENMLEAMRLKLAMWADDEDPHDWVAPGRTMIAEAAAIAQGEQP